MNKNIHNYEDRMKGLITDISPIHPLQNFSRIINLNLSKRSPCVVRITLLYSLRYVNAGAIELEPQHNGQIQVYQKSIEEGNTY